MEVDENDELVSVLPIHYSEALTPNLQIHQFPLLLTRPLQTPPTAVANGKRINARIKNNTRRIEIHVPVDTRPEVYNVDKSKEFGAGRLEDDREKNQERPDKSREDEDPRISEMRMRSEEIPQRGTYVLGIVRDGKLHLHPVNEMHQFRPSLTYLDILSRKNRRRGPGSDSDSDEGPPPDPDEIAPVPAPKKEKKPTGDSKEVHVSARKSEDQGGQSGLSNVRREMLQIIRNEEDEKWEDLQFCDVTTEESSAAFESIISQSDEILESSTSISTFIKSINGL